MNWPTESLWGIPPFVQSVVRYLVHVFLDGVDGEDAFAHKDSGEVRLAEVWGIPRW